MDVAENAASFCFRRNIMTTYIYPQNLRAKETPHIFDSYTLHLDYLLVFLLL